MFAAAHLRDHYDGIDPWKFFEQLVASPVLYAVVTLNFAVSTTSLRTESASLASGSTMRIVGLVIFAAGMKIWMRCLTAEQPQRAMRESCP